ncbi:MAG TPA: ABC transporter substrate-binding protein [Candidatus Lustribacter sp.]
MHRGPNVYRIAACLALALCWAGTGAAPAAGPLIPLEVGTMPGDASAEVYYGVDRGFFKAEGLDVHVAPFTNAPAQAAAVSAGTIVAGNGGVGSVAVARERGIFERVIAPASVYEPTALTAVLMIAKDSPLKSAPDLNGKVIGTNGLQDQAQLETMLWLEKHGADLKTIKFVEVPFPAMAGALEQHRIEAALMVEPLITAGAAGVKPFGDAMGAIAPHFITTGWFASDAWLQAHPDVAARFVRAMLRTAAWANAHHAESAQILVRSAKLDPSIAAKMTRSTYGTSLAPALMQPVLDMFLHFGILSKPMSAADLAWQASPAYPRAK